MISGLDGNATAPLASLRERNTGCGPAPDVTGFTRHDVRHDPFHRSLTRTCTARVGAGVVMQRDGYFLLDRLAVQFLYQPVSRRYQKTSLIIAPNKSRGDRGEIFADRVLASAIIDRVSNDSTTIKCQGQSYRLREKRQAGIFRDLTLPGKGMERTPERPKRRTSARGIPLRYR